MSRRWAVLVGISVVLIAAGGVLTWRSLAGAPAARIAAVGHADHRRALRLARLGPSARHGTKATTPVRSSPSSKSNGAGAPRLALVTCGGPFSETVSGGSYADNVIVEAVPAAS